MTYGDDPGFDNAMRDFEESNCINRPIPMPENDVRPFPVFRCPSCNCLLRGYRSHRNCPRCNNKLNW